MKPFLSVSFVMFCTLTAIAHWELIDDFQRWEDGNLFTEAADIDWHAVSRTGTDEYWMLADPHDPTNVSMYVEPGGGRYDDTVWVAKELPGGGIAPGETGTVFFRCLWSGWYNSWYMGTADEPLAFDPETGEQTTPGAWNDFNALICLENSNEDEPGHGVGVIPSWPSPGVDVNIWYSFWLVVSNTWDMTTPPVTSHGEFSLYVQGEGFGEGVSPTRITQATDPPRDALCIRRVPLDDAGNPQSIIWVMFASKSGPPSEIDPGDPFLLDDFYFSKGINLTDPWTLPCPDCPDENGDLDTGDFLGWINVWHAPYLWLYAIDGWVYMEEPAPDAAGAWGYFYK